MQQVAHIENAAVPQTQCLESVLGFGDVGLVLVMQRQENQ